MHKPWLYHITGISGFQVVAQRVERHGRSREIRNAHVLARCGTLEADELLFLLDKPPHIALAVLGIILNATAAYAACDRDPSQGRKRKTGMSNLTLILTIASKKSRDEGLTCKGCARTGVVPRKGERRRIRCHDVGRMRCYVEVRRMRCPECGKLFKGEAALKEFAYRLRPRRRGSSRTGSRKRAPRRWTTSRRWRPPSRTTLRAYSASGSSGARQTHPSRASTTRYAG